jgi:serine/threonine-protein kinase
MDHDQLMQPAQQADPKIGMVLQDRYRIVRLLGEGGMGAVYEGEHLLIKKRVAIKCLHAQYAQNPEVVARFHREALAATSIGHQNIIEVTDLGRFPDGSVFMVLEFLQGRDFANLIEDEGPQPLNRVVHIMMQICDALTAAHDKDIVHRDLKPENVFLIRRGDDRDFVKLLDFGISKMKSASDTPSSSMTRTGMALGTPYYMAPEQAQGRKDVDHRADIYALGVILFRALTGQHPFDHDSYPMLVLKICTEPPPPLRRYRPDLPPELEQVAAKMLAKTPDERFPNCAAVKVALRPFASFSDVPVVNEVPRNDALPLASIAGYVPPAPAAVTPGPNTPAPVSETLGTPLATQTSVTIPGTSRAPLFVGAGVVALLAIVGGGVALSGALSGPPAETPAPTPPPIAIPVAQPVVPPPIAPIPVPTPTPAERTVNIRIATTPPTAELLIDGRRRANPFNAQLPYSEDLHSIEVRAPGFVTVMQDLDLSLTQEINLALERGSGTQDRRTARPSAPTAGPAPQGTSPSSAPAPTPTAAANPEPAPTPRAATPEPSAPPPPPPPPPRLEEPAPSTPAVAPPPPSGFKKIRI